MKARATALEPATTGRTDDKRLRGVLDHQSCIGGNKYRLNTPHPLPDAQDLLLKVLTHSEYDEDKWKDEGGCFGAPPPPRKKKTASTKRPTGGR